MSENLLILLVQREQITHIETHATVGGFPCAPGYLPVLYKDVHKSVAFVRGGREFQGARMFGCPCDIRSSVACAMSIRPGGHWFT